MSVSDSPCHPCCRQLPPTHNCRLPGAGGRASQHPEDYGSWLRQTGGRSPAVRGVPLLQKWDETGLLSGSRNAEATGDFSCSSVGCAEARAGCSGVEGPVAGEEGEASVVREGRGGGRQLNGISWLAPRDEPRRRGHGGNAGGSGMRTGRGKAQDGSRGTRRVEPAPHSQVFIAAFLLD